MAASLVKIVDGRQAYEAPRVFVGIEGAADVSFYQQSATSTSSLGQATFNIQLPSETVGLCRDITYNVVGTYTINCTGGTSGQPVFAAGTFGLAESVNALIRNERIQFGAVSNDVNRYLNGPELARIHTSSELKASFLSGGPQCLDVAQDFASLVGTTLNPLAPAWDVPNSQAVPWPRTTGWTMTGNTYAVDGTASVVISFNIYFGSAVTPFMRPKNDGAAVRGTKNYILVVQYTDWNALWSYVAPATGVIGSSVTQLSTNNIEYSVINPDAEFNGQFKDIVHMSRTQEITNTAGAVAPGGVVTVSIGTCSYNTVPDMIIISCQDTALASGVGTPTKPEAWLTPVATNLKVQNRTVLQGASQMQLYKIAVKNGLKMSYEQFAGQAFPATANAVPPPTTGTQVFGSGFLVLNPALDLAISADGITNGTRINFTISGNLQFQNTSANTIAGVTVKVITVSASELICTINGVQEIIGTNDREEYMAKKAEYPSAGEYSKFIELQQVAGGSWGNFWSGFKDGFMKTMKIGLPIVQKLAGLGGGAMLPHGYHHGLDKASAADSYLHGRRMRQ